NLFLEFLGDYFAECEDHLRMVRRSLLSLEDYVGEARIDRALLDELFRSFHSLKGISGMVGLREAEALAHHLESFLRPLRDGSRALTDEGIHALVGGVDALEHVIASRRDQRAAPPIDAVVARLERA